MGIFDGLFGGRSRSEPADEEDSQERSQTDRYLGALGEAQQRGAQASLDTLRGTGEAGYNLATGKEDLGDVAEGAGQQGLRLSNAAGRNVVDVATGGRAEELRAQYRRDSESRVQYERSQENVERQGVLGQTGAVLEAGTDFALDFPGASAQNRAAERAGGRENIANRYNQAATGVDDRLEGAGLDSRTNPGAKFLSDVFVKPVAQGFSSVATGTDLETGEKVNATGEDISEVALTGLFAPFSAVGGTAIKGGVRGARATGRLGSATETARRGGQAAASATSSMNPFRFLSGLARRGDEAATASRRTVQSGDNLPVLRETTSRLDSLSAGSTAPRRVETARQTRSTTGLDTLRTTEGGAGSQRLGTGLPRSVDDTASARSGQRSTRFGGGEDTRFTDLEEGPGGVFRTAQENARLRTAEGATSTRRAASQADEGGGVLDRLRDAVPGGSQRASATVGGATAQASGAARRGGSSVLRAGGAAAGAGGSAARRAGETGGSLLGRIRQVVSRTDEAADVTRATERAEDATTAARRSDRGRGGVDAAAARRGDEAVDLGRATERTEDAATAGRRGPLSRIGDAIRNRPVTAAGLGAVGGILGVGAVAPELADLVRPDATVEGDGWRGQWRKDYNVQTSEGPDTVYQYEVFSKGDGSSLGYTVITGVDPSTGRLYYLSGSPQRPSVARSRVTSTGLTRATERAAPQANVGGPTGGGR